MIKKVVSILVVLILVSAFSMPVMAQTDSKQTNEQKNSTDSKNNSEQQNSELTPQQVLKILEIDDREKLDEVKKWVNSPESQDYPDLRKRAKDWVNNIQKQQQQKAQQLDGYKKISSSVEVVGYEFHPEEETVTILIKSDSRRLITLQDVGATIASDSGFSYRVEQIGVGVTEITMEAKEENVNGNKTQMVAVVDNEAQHGDTIVRRTDSSFFSSLKWWYIPLAGLGGAVLIFVQSIRFIRGKEQEGENEFIPLE